MNTAAAMSAHRHAHARLAFRRLALPALACLPAGSAFAQSISELGSLLPGSNCVVTAVSADGSVVAGYSNVAIGNHAFRWTAAGGMQDLGDFGYNSAGLAISADGTCVVGWAPLLITRPDGSQGGYARVIRWTAADGLQNIGGCSSFDPSNGIANSGIGRAVNADGTVVVGDGGGPCGRNEAFRWTATSGTQTLGTFPADSLCYSDVTVAGLNADGSIAVGQCSGRAYRWALGGGMFDLGNLTTNNSRMAGATSVNADGTVAVGWWGVNISGGRFQAFRWRQGVGMENLGSLGGNVQSNNISMSADGSVVVGSCDTVDGQPRPFLWTQDIGMVNLQTYLPAIGVDLTGWSLCYATGISADGRTIVGNACVSPNATSGFIVKLPAVLPSCFTLGAVSNAAICPDGSVAFSVSAAGTGSFSYQWQIEDQNAPGLFHDLVDGPFTFSGEQVAEMSGARTAHLALKDVGYANDPAWLSTPHTFQCVVATACGARISNSATMNLSTNCCKPNFVTASGCLGPTDLLQFLSLYFTDFDGHGSAVPGDNLTLPQLNPGSSIFAAPCSAEKQSDAPPVVTGAGLKADYDADCQVGPTDLLKFLGDYFNPVSDCFGGCFAAAKAPTMTTRHEAAESIANTRVKKLP